MYITGQIIVSRSNENRGRTAARRRSCCAPSGRARGGNLARHPNFGIPSECLCFGANLPRAFRCHPRAKYAGNNEFSKIGSSSKTREKTMIFEKLADQRDDPPIV